MPATTLDDGGWGAIASNFANALAPDGTRRAQIYLQGAQYQKLLLEQEEMRRRQAAMAESIKNYPSTIPENASMPLNADGTPAYGPVSPDMQREHTTRRNQQILDNAAATLLAKNAEDFAKGVHGQRAAGAIAGGIPGGRAQQDVLQTQLSLIGGSLPQYSTTPHTYQPTDASGTAIGPAISSRRIPEGPSTMVSPTKAGPVNYFENSGTANQRLFQLSQKAAREPLSIGELEEANVHLQNEYPVKNVAQQGPDGSRVVVPMREKPIPETFNPLVTRIAELNAWKASRQPGGQPMPQPAPAPAAPGAAAVSPDATTGGLTGGAPVVPAAAAAPAPAPVVPAPRGAVGGLTAGTDIGAPTQVMPGDASPLRKEFQDHPAVKKYEQAILPYEQFRENVKVGTPQADIALIYNLAKIFDPESVVREGEMIIWQKTGGPFDRLRGLYDKIIEDKAQLSPKVRANLADAAERAMQANHRGVQQTAQRFAEIATEMGIKPSLIVPKIGELEKIDRKTIASITPAGPGPKGRPETSTVAPAAAAPAPTPGAQPRRIRVNPQTGQIEEVR